ncbi:alpha/beta fold hydrolase [Cohnella boryungensis]|uniref:Alpha/beta fold hydrolase n=1 Tax=Cohnella boryungensis TaxID=768479 RepID=A0ABV8SJ99_9BACL
MIRSHFISHDGVTIHYLTSNEDSTSVPLLICPGLSETAEEYIELMEYLAPRKCIALSFRGRGLSDTPDRGYGLDEHVADIEAVIADAKPSRFHLFANSRGVSYALGYCDKHPSNIIQSLILQDYPAEHKAMPEGWADEYIHHYLVPFSRQRNIRQEAVRGIAEESIAKRFSRGIHKRLLVLRGKLEGSLLSDEDCRRYERLCVEASFAAFEHSGHDIRNTEKDRLYRTIYEFIHPA